MVDYVPMHQVEALVEWLVPTRGVQMLTDAINHGELHVFARSAPPATGVTYTETQEDGTEAAPAWIDRWTDGPLAPDQAAFARVAANFPYSGWERWYDHLVGVVPGELAATIDRVADLVPRGGDGPRWTAAEAFAWIAHVRAPAIALGPAKPDFAAAAWTFASKANPWHALIWRVERAAGTWRGLPGQDAPSSRAVFDALHGALWPSGDGLTVHIETADGWRDAPAAAFAGAAFDTAATALDLASGARLVFDAAAVRSRWPIDPTDRVISREAASTNPKPGRPKGTGTFADRDRPLVEEMRSMILATPGLSVHAAATVVAPRAAGGAGEERKRRRLGEAYRRTYPN